MGFFHVYCYRKQRQRNLKAFLCQRFYQKSVFCILEFHLLSIVLMPWQEGFVEPDFCLSAGLSFAHFLFLSQAREALANCQWFYDCKLTVDCFFATLVSNGACRTDFLILFSWWGFLWSSHEGLLDSVEDHFTHVTYYQNFIIKYKSKICL